MSTEIVLNLLDCVQQVRNLEPCTPAQDMLPQAAATAEMQEVDDMKRSDWRRTQQQPWYSLDSLESLSFRCGYCSNDVASEKGWWAAHDAARIRICPHCNAPTFFSAQNEQWPGPMVGEDVPSLPDDVRAAYDEARSAITVNAFTGTVMICRKILMHVAVDKGAKTNQSFQRYVGWLAEEHYVPKGGEVWLSYIKDRGNEANHEIPHMTYEDATALIQFREALLRNVYSLPAAVPKKPSDAS